MSNRTHLARSRRHRALAAGASIMGVLCFAVPPAAAVDLSVTGVEVTQATQTATNTIPLVAGRSTAIRATIGVADTGGAPVAGVTGAAHVFVNGTAITPTAGVPPINAPFTASVAPQRANENDTLNFELITPAALAASGDVDVRVDVAPVAGETNTGNNSSSANDLSALGPATPSLFFTRINFTASGLGLTPLAFAQSPTGDAMVRGILPVNDGDANLYRQGLFPTLTFGTDDGANNIVDGDDINDILTLLEACRQLIVSAGLGATNTTFLHGWVAGNPISGNGWAPIGGRVSFGNSDPIRAQRTYAHELTHNLGFDHITTNIDQVGWDVGARLPNNPAGNNVVGRVKPTTLFDIMVAGLLTNQAWIDTAKYTSLQSNAALGFSSPDVGDQLRPRRRVAVVRGVFDPEGRQLERLLPVFRFPWRSQPTPAPREGQFVVEAVDTAGRTMRVPFEPRLGDDERLEPFGAFTVMVPVARAIRSLRVTDREGERTFGRLRMSRPPAIRIRTPEEGARLGRRTTVRWQARDADTPASRLLFQVAYSPNDGRRFVPVAVDVRGNSARFNSRLIQRSRRGRGLIRVFVSDGLNTAFDDVAGLTAARARFPAPRR
jgi:hypothetical protein